MSLSPPPHGALTPPDEDNLTFILISGVLRTAFMLPSGEGIGDVTPGTNLDRSVIARRRSYAEHSANTSPGHTNQISGQRPRSVGTSKISSFLSINVMLSFQPFFSIVKNSVRVSEISTRIRVLSCCALSPVRDIVTNQRSKPLSKPFEASSILLINEIATPALRKNYSGTRYLCRL